MQKYKLAPIILLMFITFKLMASGEYGHHGQHALRAVVAVKRPVRENAMIPSHFMAEQHALAMPGNATNAIKIHVPVTTLIINFFYYE